MADEEEDEDRSREDRVFFFLFELSHSVDWRLLHRRRIKSLGRWTNLKMSVEEEDRKMMRRDAQRKSRRSSGREGPPAVGALLRP
jgi:hypothetical protein